MTSTDDTCALLRGDIEHKQTVTIPGLEKALAGASREKREQLQALLDAERAQLAVLEQLVAEMC